MNRRRSQSPDSRDTSKRMRQAVLGVTPPLSRWGAKPPRVSIWSARKAWRAPTPSEAGQEGGAVKTELKQSASEVSGVPAGAKQGTEPPAQGWAWVEATVWNERRLAALGNGVQGGKWFSLSDKVSRRSPTLAEGILGCARTIHLTRSPCETEPIPMREPPTGELCAGEPPAQFGGRGRR